MTVLLGKAFQWKKLGKEVSIKLNRKSRAFPYMQRMDFFTHLGIDLEENFQRKDSSGRFLSLERIGRGGNTNTAAVSSKIAEILVPEEAEETDPDKSNFLDCIEYCVSELMNNVIQHSEGEGFVCAQFYPTKQITQIVIADAGIGIYDSFRSNRSPFAKEMNSDAEAIAIALKPTVSSRSHLVEPWGGESVNAGVGLTILRELTLSTGGEFGVASGRSAMFGESMLDLGSDTGFDGTLVTCSIKRSELGSFHDRLEEIKNRLLPDTQLDWEIDTDLADMFE